MSFIKKIFNNMFSYESKRINEAEKIVEEVLALDNEIQNR